MSLDGDSSVIKKKARSGREDFDARAMSWSKAMRLSLERVSDRLFDLQVSVRTVEQMPCTLAELKDQAGGDRLLMLLDVYGDLVPDGDAAQEAESGAAILDRGLVQSLVEVQTRGYVTDVELETRGFTATDAAVTAQLLDPVLRSVDEMMVETPQSPDPLRLRYGDKVEDARALVLALEAPDYILFRISVDIEEGKRSGEIVLALPEYMLRPPKPVKDEDELEKGAFDLSAMALSSPIPLNAVLMRMSLPLSRVSALKPGDTLKVERSALSKTELVGSKGFMLGKVSLGQMNGFRAVQLAPAEGEKMASGLPAPNEAASAQPMTAAAAPAGLDVPGLPAPHVPEGTPMELPGDLAMDLPSGDDALSDSGVGLGSSGPGSLEDLPALSPDVPDLGAASLGSDGLPDMSDLPGLGEPDVSVPDLDDLGLPDIPGLPSL